jgi:hypothetical protein
MLLRMLHAFATIMLIRGQQTFRLMKPAKRFVLTTSPSMNVCHTAICTNWHLCHIIIFNYTISVQHLSDDIVFC